MLDDAGLRRKFNDPLEKSAGEIPSSLDLFQDIGLPVMILDPDRRIVAANGSVAKVIGMPAAETIGRTCCEIFHTSDSERATAQENCPFTRAMASRDSSAKSMEVVSDGKTFIVSCAPVFDENGDVDRIIHISWEVTAPKTALRKSDLKRLHELKMASVGRLAGNIAHDFNNLLLPILAYSEMLTNDLTHRDPRQRSLLQIKRAAERAKELTGQLLAFSRHQVMDLKVQNLNRMVTNFGAVFKDSINDNIEFRTKLAPKRITFMADVTQVERVLMILVQNAQDAMADGGVLTIETDLVEIDDNFANDGTQLRPGTYAVLSVRDTGRGIREEILPDIFDPFVTTKQSGMGAGLGLSTAFGVVKQHNGNIEVESEAGKGTEFRVYFPKLEGVTSSVDGVIEKMAIIGGDETILVVEDDDSVRVTIQHLLKNLGYRVLVARDGEGGLELAKNHPDSIALLLTDLMMPNLDGIELFRKLRETRPAIKAIYMSGLTVETVDEQNLSMEHTDFLSKPFTLGVLAGKIRDKLDVK